MSVDKYIQEAINMVEDKLAKSDQQLYKSTKSAIQTGYRPALDLSQSLVMTRPVITEVQLVN